MLHVGGSRNIKATYIIQNSILEETVDEIVGWLFIEFFVVKWLVRPPVRVFSDLEL